MGSEVFPGSGRQLRQRVVDRSLGEAAAPPIVPGSSAVSSPVVDEHIPAGYTAEWMSAWVGVKKGLSRRQILKMLGTPLRRRVSVVDVWYYVSDDESGWVAFYDDQVILWRRP